MNTFPDRAPWCVALLVLAAPVSFAQLYTGSLTLTVRDPASAPVPEAKITLADMDRSTENSAKTDRSGQYVFPSLSPGKYSLKIDAAGFEPFELNNIEIAVSAKLSADAKLRLQPERARGLVAGRRQRRQ